MNREYIYEDAEIPSCHASTVVELSDGTIGAAWFGGTHESHSDVKIYFARRENGRWSGPRVAGDGREGGKDFACYNPVLVQVPKGDLLLFYKYGTGPQTWHRRMVRSTDGGRHWGPPVNLPEGVYGPIKNKPFRLADGTLLCGSSTEDHGWRVRFESTSDEGKTWQVGPFVNDGKQIGAIQPAIVPLGGDRLRALGRTQQGRVFAIDSADLGKTWGEMRLLDVPNPNCGLDAIRLQDGRFLMVYNHTESGRSPLNLAISEDAEHWRPIRVLDHREGGEFSYPAMIQSLDGTVHLTYTWERKRIVYWSLDPLELHEN